MYVNEKQPFHGKFLKKISGRGVSATHETTKSPRQHRRRGSVERKKAS
jgi:hypothetical protein